MADLLFVTVTVAFFLAASGYVTLCDRILGRDSTSVTEPGSNELLAIDVGESADADPTEQKGVPAR